MTDYERQRREAAATFYTTYAAPIAAALGEGWTANADRDYHTPTVTLTHRDGRYFRLSRKRERVKAFAPYILTPIHKHGPTQKRPQAITMTATKSPPQLAADIRRRLLPQLAEYMDDIRYHIRKEAQIERELHDITGMLAESGHGRVSVGHNGQRTAHRGNLYRGGWTAEYCTYTKNVDLKICTDPQTASRLLELFTELHPTIQE